MATTTIGTTGRNYSTIASWESTETSNGDIGEMYDDSAFDETWTFSSGGTGRILRAATGEGHDGTAGSGVRIVRTATGMICQFTSNANCVVSQVEFNCGGYSSGSSAVATIECANNQNGTVTRCIVHNVYETNNYQVEAFGGGGDIKVLNTICYDYELDRNSAVQLAGYYLPNVAQDGYCQNSTFVNFVRNQGSGSCTLIAMNASSSVQVCQNNIAMDPSGSSSGAKNCFGGLSGSVTYDHLMSSDTTAAGTGSLTSKTSSNQFVSTTGGSEDYHLKAGADAIDAGTDLGTSPSYIEVDIDGRDRDAEGDTWDMGAHELVSASGPAAGLRTLSLTGLGI